MLRRFAFLLLLSTITVAPLQAQTSSSASSLPSKFAPLEYLVGHCWRGTFAGSSTTDEHCFEWVFDQKFVRDRHVVRGGDPYGGETIYFWDVTANRIGFSYWNTVGQMMKGYVASVQGDTLGFVTSVASAKATTEIRSTWTRDGSTSYRVRSLERSGDAWKESFALDMKRVK
ncbi:MAG TPA: hypothetical protein VGM82_07265 [Gemmatimonadaceae bacterium]|jgi:hypothetical protein